MDLNIEKGEYAISIRAGAIILRDDAVLMVSDDRRKYYYTVGGRVRLGENTEEAVTRETFEETGLHLDIDRLGFVTETTFHADDLMANGTNIVEYGYYYYMKSEGVDIEAHDFEDNGTHHLVWLPLASRELVHPTWLLDELRCPSDGIKHIILDERK